MKKYLLVLFMMLSLTGVAFAVPTDPPAGSATAIANVASGNTQNGQGAVMNLLSPSATIGNVTGGTATVGNITNTATGGAGGSVIDNSKTFNTNTAIGLGGAGGTGGSGGAVIGSGNSSNFNVNAPSAKVDIEKGAIVNTNTANPTNTFTPTNINTVGSGIGNFSPKAVIEEGAVKNTNTNTNLNTNVNTNKIDNTNIGINKQQQGQIQGQQQKQQQQQGQTQSQAVTNSGNSTNTVSPVITANPTNTNVVSPTNTQAQNNAQVISPSQEINISAPDRVVVGAAPNFVGGGELNFVSPNERDVQTLLPKFGCGTVAPLTVTDCIVDVLWQKNDIKFKDLYTEVLRGLRSDAVTKLGAKAVRYQIREAASSKTWTTGGSVAGNGAGTVGSGVGGIAGGILPQVGRSKSSNLYTIIFVQVQQFK